MNITDKLNHEYELYFSELLKESKENIILQSYKTSIYKEILLVLTENCNENNQKIINFISETEYPIAAVYNAWLDTSVLSSISDDILYCIYDVL